MKTIKRILFGMGILLAILIVISFFLPSGLHISKSMEINAPAAVVFDQFNTLKNWEQWSPWIKMDPQSERKYFGSGSGVGSGYTWKGEKTGEGKLTITESNPYTSIVTELEMRGQLVYPGFNFEESDGKTKVTWYFDSDAGWNPFGRYMNLMIKEMLGHQFEQGLKDVKQIVESMPVAEPDSKIPIEVVNTDSIFYLSLRDTANSETIGMKLGQGYAALQQEIKKQKLQMNGAPFAIYYSDSESEFDMDIALPVNRPGKESGKIKAGILPPGKAVVAHYFGAYEKTPEGHRAIVKFIQKNNLTVGGPPREHYITDPMAEPDTSKWQTDIYYPLK
jgi:effector-binding domain-containing protein